MAEEEGILPPALEAQPDIPEHLRFAWDAFWFLMGDRALSLGTVGPIHWVAISVYADRAGVSDPDQFDRLVRLVKAMDWEWRAFMAEKMKAKD